MRPLLAALAILIAGTMTAHADFVLLAAPQATRPTAQPAPPTRKPAALFIRLPLPLPPVPPPGTSGKNAYGFGNRVPLSFACRQIVPRGIKVVYGPGAQPSMTVTWQGGGLWQRISPTRSSRSASASP